MKYSFVKTVNPEKLSGEIRASAITVALDYVETVENTVNCYFKTELGGADEAELTALVAAHDPAVAPSQPAPAVVQTSTPANEHLLLPLGLVKGKAKGSDFCAPITLSARNGEEFTYACDKVPAPGSYLLQDDAVVRVRVVEVDTDNHKLTVVEGDGDKLNLSQPILISNPAPFDCELPGGYPLYYIWGVFLQCESAHNDDFIRLAIMAPTEEGLVEVKAYDECWAKTVTKRGEIKTPDGAPGELPPGCVIRINYYRAAADETVVHVYADHIITAKT